MAKFTMADLLNSQSKKTEERPAFEIRHIPIDKLKPSKKNQYGIREICINSEYKIQDFRVFVEYPTGEGGDNGTKKHDNR